MSDVLISAAYSRSAGLLKNGKKEDRKKCEGKKKEGGDAQKVPLSRTVHST